MFARRVTWCLRAGAWLLLASAVVRPIWHARASWIVGRLYQMQFIGECDAASRAFFAELGLNEHFNNEEFGLRAEDARQFSLPALLTVRRDRGEHEWRAYFCLDSSGNLLKPPLIAGPLGDEQLISASCIESPESSDSGLTAVWIIRNGWDDDGLLEDEIWYFAGDRWVNAFRAARRQKSLIATFGSWPEYESEAKNWKRFRLTWSSLSRSYEPPPDLEELETLELLPDQRSFGPIPLVPERNLNAVVKSEGAYRAVQLMEEASRATGRMFRIPLREACNWSWDALKEHRIDDAYVLSEECIRQRPDLAEAYHLLGEAHLRIGDRALGLHFLSAAVWLGNQTKAPGTWLYEESLERALLGCPEEQ